MPRDLKQVHPLMGGVEYYRKFLSVLSKRIRPITSLLRKRVSFEFTPTMELIVSKILAKVATRSILVFPDWDAVADNPRLYHVYCDACIDDFGAALEQEQPGGAVRPVAYVSRTTLDSERY